MFDGDDPVAEPVQWPQPGALWSLWEMLRPYAFAFTYIVEKLGDFRKIDPRPEALEAARRRLTDGDKRTGMALDELLALYTVIIPEWAKGDDNPIPLKSSLAQLKHIDEMCRRGYRESQLFDEIEQLNRRFREDLQGLKFYFVRDDLVSYYVESKPFGDEVFQSFWSANDDLVEAGKCLALGRSTACVMHLMRAAEVALKALAKACGVGVQNDWGSYLREINKALTAKLQASGKRSPEEQFYSEAATIFERLKVAWRNPSMHVEKSYTEERAKEIYAATRAFMQHLAPKISE